MQAIQYQRSVARFLTARLMGRRWKRVYTSRFGTIRLADVDPPPLPGPEWVRVRPSLSGICGSDLATITAKGSTYFSTFTSFPFVLGHEVVGRVEETGSKVDRVRSGDRVVLEPPLHCRIRGIDSICSECAAGRNAHCLNVNQGTISAGIQTGFCRDTGGGWSSGFVAHQLQLHRIPDDLSDEAAVLIEPLSCSLHAARAAPLRDEQTAIVIGCGTIGVLTIAAIRALGSGCRLIAVAKYRHQKRAAKEFGADIVVSTGKSLYPEVAELLGASIHRPDLSREVLLGGADACFDCIGSSLSIDDSLRFVRNRGTVVLVGMPGVPDNVDWTSIWYKELKLTGSYTSDTETFKKAVLHAAAAKEKMAQIVNARFPLTNFREAIQTALHSGTAGVLKTVFQP